MAVDPQLTFSDEFNSLNLRNGDTGTWSTNYWWGQPNGVTLAGNGEQQWYIDANYGPTQSVKPWTVNNGVLDITAQNASPEIQPQINGYQYTSGMLTTHDSFSQTYGYFEMKAELPQGSGLWPAFWLLPENGAWPPEIDVMEQLGNDPNTYYTAAHTLQTGAHTSQGGVVSTPDLTSDYHTYGLDWEADKLTYYFDDKQVWQTDTPADMHQPMYMLVNLAVGGYWPGNPTPDPNYSETMHVDYIHAYTAKPDGQTASAPVGAATVVDPSPATTSSPSAPLDTATSAPQLAETVTPTPPTEPAPSATTPVETAPQTAALQETPQPETPQPEAATPAPSTEPTTETAFDFSALAPTTPVAADVRPTQPSADAQALDLQTAVDAAAIHNACQHGRSQEARADRHWMHESADLSHEHANHHAHEHGVGHHHWSI